MHTVCERERLLDECMRLENTVHVYICQLIQFVFCSSITILCWCLKSASFVCARARERLIVEYVFRKHRLCILCQIDSFRL